MVYHIFSQPPPKQSWTGKAKVPLAHTGTGTGGGGGGGGKAAEYVDELGCEASLRSQLAALADTTTSTSTGKAAAALPEWSVEMHLDVDPVASLLHMAKADVLIASDSSFSLIAAILSHGLVLSRSGWKRFGKEARAGMVNPLTLSDDGGFDCADAAALWRRRGGRGGRRR